MLIHCFMNTTVKTGKGILLRKLKVISLYINQTGFFFPDFLSLFQKDTLNNETKDQNSVVIFENAEKAPNTIAMFFMNYQKQQLYTFRSLHY